MSWLERLIRRAPELTAFQAERLSAWGFLNHPPDDTSFEKSRYVVVDVESSGLNINKDRLIAIGAVAVRNGRIQLDDSFEIVLQQSQVSEKENILIHGIGGTAQRLGMPPADALLAFLEYLRNDPLIAFHVAFDEAMIRRAMKQFLGLTFRHLWADLAYVTPALNANQARRCRSLDDWMRQFGIENYARHNALADAMSTAELLLALRPQIQSRGPLNLRRLRDLEREGRRIVHPA